jgi:hypothetical protein
MSPEEEDAGGAPQKLMHLEIFWSYIFLTPVIKRSPPPGCPSGQGDGHPKPTRALRPQ